MSRPPVRLPTNKLSTAEVNRVKDVKLGLFKHKPTKPLREFNATVQGGPRSESTLVKGYLHGMSFSTRHLLNTIFLMLFFFMASHTTFHSLVLTQPAKLLKSNTGGGSFC